MNSIRLAAAAALLACAAGITAAQEMVPNPAFASWSKLPKGTTVTFKLGGSKLERKLLRADANKVVVEDTASTEFDGKEIRAKAREQEIPKTVAKARDVLDPQVGVVPSWMAGKGKPPAGVTQGEEKMKIGDTEIKTRWYSQTDPKTKIVAKSWVSDDVPGMLVKIELIGVDPAAKKAPPLILFEVVGTKKASTSP